MTNEEILSKAISKAKGYKYGCIIFPEVLKDNRYYTIIFSHDFAKAFWGEKVNCINCPAGKIGCDIFEDCNKPNGVFLWQFHLQQMVLEKEPLKYLEKFLGV